MASVKDIVQLESERSNPEQYGAVHLFHEGSFLRAYEWSAWLLCRYVHEFKVTRRQYKDVDNPVIFVGFPQTSLPKFVPEGCEVKNAEEKHMMMILPMTLTEENVAAMRTDYKQWCNDQPLIESSRHSQQNRLSAENHPASITNVINTIQSFPIESKSPIDCMLFLAEIKAQLASLI